MDQFDNVEVILAFTNQMVRVIYENTNDEDKRKKHIFTLNQMLEVGVSAVKTLRQFIEQNPDTEIIKRELRIMIMTSLEGQIDPDQEILLLLDQVVDFLVNAYTK